MKGESIFKGTITAGKSGPSQRSGKKYKQCAAAGNDPFLFCLPCSYISAEFVLDEGFRETRGGGCGEAPAAD
jgi:hypothetical protein